MTKFNLRRFSIMLVLAAVLAASAVSALAQAPTTTPTPSITPTPGLGPLGTPLPPPGPLPVSAWRPPLYPVPWSLTRHDHFFFTRPIAADEVNWPLPDYRYGGAFFGPDNPHTGVDIAVPEGTPVLAAGPGSVVWTGYGLYRGVEDLTDPYGLAVAIRHDFGYNRKSLTTVYAHMSEIQVVEGQYVGTGDVLGLSGETGKVTGPHLHFEVRLGAQIFSSTYNPELWISPPQGWGVLVGRLTNTFWEPLLNHDLTVTNVDTGQIWYAETYDVVIGINPDPFYNENFVLSDLPAGRYSISTDYGGTTFDLNVQVFPGAITYFSFRGYHKFSAIPLNIPIPTNVPTPQRAP